jgi:FkbM family methyltransferase
MRIMGRIPGGILDRIERGAARAQGKGFGALSIKHEVDAIRLLVPDGVQVRTVIDVGANRGLWTEAALLAFPDAHIHAFEPAAACQAELEGRYARVPRVTLNSTALGAVAGEGVLHSDAPGGGPASLTLRQLDHVGLTMDLEEPVEVSTLDAYVAARGIDRVDVLKIDVEGHELDVLKGAAASLATISVVQFEFGGTAIDTRTFFRDYWTLLTDAGFTLWRIGPWGVRRITRYRETDEHFACTNYVAVRT